MSFWSWLVGAPNHAGITSNDNSAALPPTVGAVDYTPGDPDGVDLSAFADLGFQRALPTPQVSPWDGWPSDWSTPTWVKAQQLVDTAWACLDLNSSILSTMPVLHLGGDAVERRAVEPSWIVNPDPSIYTSWHEFAKQLFWDYQLGEAFVLATEWYASGYPSRFRVIPAPFVRVEVDRITRRYFIGDTDVSDDILHIRYQSTTSSTRGSGPLEAGGARMTTAGVLQRYVSGLAETGGTTNEWLAIEKLLTKDQADDLLEQWVDSRQRNLGKPAVLSGGADLKQAKQMSAKEMALLELAQFTESRIAILLGVPPFLVGLPSGGDPMTYSNQTGLFDFHDRASLRPKGTPVMAALSGWALPRGQRLELHHDEYSRPALPERATAYATLHGIGAISRDEIRKMERFHGDAPEAPDVPVGGDVTSISDRVNTRSVEHRNEARREPIELRRAVVESVDFPERIIEFIAVPYDDEISVRHTDGSMIRESVDPSAFKGVESQDLVTINRDHDHTRLVGKVVSFNTSDERGLIVRARIAETPLGDETLQLAREGILRASVGMVVPRSGQRVRNGLRRIKRAMLDHIALLPNPAYAATPVLSVRDELLPDKPDTLRTPRLDALLEELGDDY